MARAAGVCRKLLVDVNRVIACTARTARVVTPKAPFGSTGLLQASLPTMFSRTIGALDANVQNHVVAQRRFMRACVRMYCTVSCDKLGDKKANALLLQTLRTVMQGAAPSAIRELAIAANKVLEVVRLGLPLEPMEPLPKDAWAQVLNATPSRDSSGLDFLGGVSAKAKKKAVFTVGESVLVWLALRKRSSSSGAVAAILQDSPVVDESKEQEVEASVVYAGAETMWVTRKVKSEHVIEHYRHSAVRVLKGGGWSPERGDSVVMTKNSTEVR